MKEVCSCGMVCLSIIIFFHQVIVNLNINSINIKFENTKEYI